MNKAYLKTLVRTMYDFQDMRIRTGNRLRLKKDDSPQDEENMNDAFIDADGSLFINGIKEDTQKLESQLAKEIQEIVKEEPMWSAFFEGVKGCGILMAAAIMAEIDIEKATTVSKIWQFCGLNPGMVVGKKRVQKGKDAKSFDIVPTETMIRGDRMTAGFVRPYNAWLRTKIVGVLASCIIKAQGEYALNFYYPYKNRLEQEEGWKEESKGHRDHAAKRYMMKMFLKDMYVAWRTLEGLPVREPYQVEYLGKKHNAA